MPVRPLSHSDIQQLKKLQPPGWGGIDEAFETYLTRPFSRAVKFEDEGIFMGVGNATNLGKTAWLSHIIVGEAYRSRGIAKTLVSNLLDDLDRKGVRTVSLIATDLGRPVYLKQGFRDEEDYHFFQKEEEGERLPPSPRIEPYDDRYYTLILELDRWVSGEDRSRLITPYLDRAFVYKSNRSVEGYFLPGLGEGLIAAKTDEAARALMAYKYKEDQRAVLPSSNKRGILILKELGFAKSTIRAKRMVRGPELPRHPAGLFNRIGGKLG